MPGPNERAYVPGIEVQGFIIEYDSGDKIEVELENGEVVDFDVQLDSLSSGVYGGLPPDEEPENPTVENLTAVGDAVAQLIFYNLSVTAGGDRVAKRKAQAFATSRHPSDALDIEAQVVERVGGSDPFNPAGIREGYLVEVFVNRV